MQFCILNFRFSKPRLPSNFSGCFVAGTKALLISGVWMSSPTPDGENEAATTALRTGAAQDGHPREKNARITYAGETDVFEGHIPQIQKSFSQQTFAFTRRNSLQSHSASFEKDAFVFVKLPPPVCNYNHLSLLGQTRDLLLPYSMNFIQCKLNANRMLAELFKIHLDLVTPCLAQRIMFKSRLFI